MLDKGHIHGNSEAHRATECLTQRVLESGAKPGLELGAGEVIRYGHDGRALMQRHRSALGEERLLAGREVVDHRRPEATEIGRVCCGRHRFIHSYSRPGSALPSHVLDRGERPRPETAPSIAVHTVFHKLCTWERPYQGAAFGGRSGWPRTLTTHRGPRQRVIHRQSRKAQCWSEPGWFDRAGLTGLGPHRNVAPVDHCRRVAPVRVAPRGVAALGSSARDTLT